MSVKEFLAAHWREISTCDEEEFESKHEKFTRDLAALEQYQPDELCDEDLANYRRFFSGAQKRYLALQEKKTNREMSFLNFNSASQVFDHISNGFGRSSYQRVQGLLELVDFATCKKVVMIGSGAFPATLLWLGDHFPAIEYVGLDVDESCVAMANNLFASIGWKNVSCHTLNGALYDYSDADFIYVANHVTPKLSVLEKIDESASKPIQVVVREPTLRGQLFSEEVRSVLPSRFEICDSGMPSDEFLSYDLTLSWKPA